MSVKRLETLIENLELLSRAKLALKAVHQWNTRPEYKYYPNAGEIHERVAKQLSGNTELADFGMSYVADKNSLDALNRERQKVEDLHVVEFLKQGGFIEELGPGQYWVPPEVADLCPRLYE